MKNKSTKHALLASVLSIVMCFAMLIGSTFAWFTDEVKSGMNKIVAGNLDVELEYSLDGTTWTAVDETTNMFKEDALWEPGYTEVVYLRVSNVGSLALKYQFGINVADKVIGKTADDRDIDLSDFIEFGVVETEAIFADRAAARAAVNGNTALISAGYSSAEGHLIAGDKSNMIALVVYMPETVDNAANYAGDNQPSINLGIKLVATQDAVENDSFGNDYDDNVDFDGEVSSVDSLIAAFNKGGSYKLAEDIALTEAVSIPEGVEVILNLGGHTISNDNGYAIVNNGNLTIDGNGSVAALGGIRSDAGKLTINDGNFNGSSDWNTGTYQHTLRAENCEVVINGGTFDATVNGQTNAMIGLYGNATMTINGGTFKNVNGALSRFDPYLFNYADNAKLIINDGTFYGGWRFNFAATTDIYGGNFTITYDGQSFQSGNPHVLTVYGGNFTPVTGVTSSLANKLPDVVAENYLIIENADGTKTVTPNIAYANPSTQDELNNILNNPTNANGEAAKEVVVELSQGNYTLPAITGNKKVTILGGDNTVIDMTNSGIIGAQNVGLDLTIEGAKVNFTNDNYKGITHSKKVTYKNCTITGKQFMYAEEVEFINCKFVQDVVDYNVWTYGAGKVLFDNCEFSCKGKSVLIYTEGADTAQNVEFRNCKFNASSLSDGKAAIEIDSYGRSYNVIIDQATAENVTGFDNGSVSGSPIWNVKKNVNPVTVTVAGTVVYNQ